MNIERENQKYKECGPFNVALDYVSFEDGTYEWQVSIEWTDGAPSTDMDFKTYNQQFDAILNGEITIMFW